jgi:hypothetical protein
MDLTVLQETLDPFDTEREARRAGGIPDPVLEERMPPVPFEEVLPPDLDEMHRTADKLCQMLACFNGGEWGRLGQSIRVALEGDVSKQPEIFHWDEEPFDFIDRHRLSVRSDLINVPRQKRPAHRPRDPRVGDRNFQLLEDFRQMTADPKVKKTAVYQELADKYGITVGYVKQILRTARKIGAL